MTDDTIDELDRKAPNDLMILVRSGIFLYVAITESLLTIGMFLREIMIAMSVEPRNVELITEISQIAVLLLVSPFLSKKISTVIRKGESECRKLLRNITVVFVLTICLVLLHNYYLVYLYPPSYGYNLQIYQDYYCANPGANWASYWFLIFRCLFIGVIFARK